MLFSIRSKNFERTPLGTVHVSVTVRLSSCLKSRAQTRFRDERKIDLKILDPTHETVYILSSQTFQTSKRLFHFLHHSEILPRWQITFLDHKPNAEWCSPALNFLRTWLVSSPSSYIESSLLDSSIRRDSIFVSWLIWPSERSFVNCFRIQMSKTRRLRTKRSLELGAVFALKALAQLRRAKLIEYLQSRKVSLTFFLS